MGGGESAGTGFRGHAIIICKGGGESGNEAIQYEVLSYNYDTDILSTVPHTLCRYTT